MPPRSIPKEPPPALMKRYRSLAEAEGRRAAGWFIVEGPRAIRQLVQSSPGNLIEILHSAELPRDLGKCSSRQIPERAFRSLSHARTPQGILAIARLPAETYSDALPHPAGRRVLLLEDIQDPGNIGTLIRTAAAFDFSGIILSDRCADPFSPKCVQSTSGSVLSVWIRRTPHYRRLVERLRHKKHRLVTADVRGRSGPSILGETPDIILALANESSGPSDWLERTSDHRFRIPVRGAKAESLNVAACGAIAMYLCRRGD